MSYSDELLQELTRAGITGRLRTRIVAEFQDHLQCDPEADLGAPRALAHQFADEIGTSRVRWAARWSFAALALAGILFAIVFLAAPGHAFGAIAARLPWPGRLTNFVVLFAPQVAFVAGVLALARALRRRRAKVIASAEARIMLRRVIVGLLGGVATMVALGILALELRPYLPGWWVTLADACAGFGLAGLLVATPAAVSAARLRPTAPGPAGDMFDDFGALVPAPLRGRPWRLALLVAGLIVVVLGGFGFLASDGPDGVVRGIADALACLFGFATLGRYLGLWSPDRAPGPGSPPG
jgi:hypothetical protein